MGMLFVFSIGFLNVLMLWGGFVYIKNFCNEEIFEMQKHRKMTHLEIRLLNKKIKELCG